MPERVALTVREMTLDEAPPIVDYFHAAALKHLDTLGVDPLRLPARTDWLERYREEYERPFEERRTTLVL